MYLIIMYVLVWGPEIKKTSNHKLLHTTLPQSRQFREIDYETSKHDIPQTKEDKPFL